MWIDQVCFLSERQYKDKDQMFEHCITETSTRIGLRGRPLDDSQRESDQSD